MDPLLASLILFAGLILVAGAGTGLVLTQSPPSPGAAAPAEPERPAYDPAVAAAIFCPVEENLADVRLGLSPDVSPPALTVLQCGHFGEGPVTCERECLGAPVVA